MERMNEAWETTFYRERWTAAGLEQEDIRGLDDIFKIPTFTMADLHASLAENPPYGSHHHIGREAFTTRPVKINISDGMTPRVALFDAATWEVQAIQAARAFYAQGARPGDVSQIPITNSLTHAPWVAFAASLHWLGCTPLTTGADTVTPNQRQIELARIWGTNWWFGFPHHLAELPKVARDMGFDIKELPTKFLHSYLGPDTGRVRRRQLEETWGVPVYDNYGALELGVFAFECQQQDRMHVQEDMTFVEMVDVENETPVTPGEIGHLVATNLWKSSIPIIRYNLRDRMRLSEREQCGCGIHSVKISGMLGS